jgi:pimeloyl-ACP methyl ester carboxylesterase
MNRYDAAIDISGADGVDLPGSLRTAVTVCLPDRVDGGVAALFGFPGGGYGRRYYDITSLPGYSQAEHHTDHGFVFVACDHLGVGASSQPGPFDLTYENLAAANHATTTRVLEGLTTGTLIEGVDAIRIDGAVGMGQSMGGCLLTVQQANHETFDAVVFLGWSGIFTNFPSPDGTRATFPMPARGTDLRPVAADVLGVVAPDEDQVRFCFHWADVEPALVEPDVASYKPYSGVVRGDDSTPWGSATVPPCAVTMMTQGSVAAEAASIHAPVLVACGERDVVPDPWSEPTAYRSSGDVSVFVVPRMAHMHNFARSRERLWRRLDHFAATTLDQSSHAIV